MSQASSGETDDRQRDFDPLARLDRGAEEEHQRQVDDAQPDHLDGPAGSAAPERRGGDPEGEEPGQESEADHRPAPLRDHRHPVAEGFDRGRIDLALGADRLPRHLVGDRDSEAVEDRRRDVGREDVAVEPGAVGGQVAVEAGAGDSDRQLPVLRRRRPLDRDHELVAFPRPASRAAAGSRLRTSQGLPAPASVVASRPGTISAGADSARSDHRGRANGSADVIRRRAAGRSDGRRASRRPGSPGRCRDTSAPPGRSPAPRSSAPARTRPSPAAQEWSLGARKRRSRLWAVIGWGSERLVLFRLASLGRPPTPHRKS